MMTEIELIQAAQGASDLAMVAAQSAPLKDGRRVNVMFTAVSHRDHTSR
jgi:hypothetical protein